MNNSRHEVSMDLRQDRGRGGRDNKWTYLRCILKIKRMEYAMTCLWVRRISEQSKMTLGFWLKQLDGLVR